MISVEDDKLNRSQQEYSRTMLYKYRNCNDENGTKNPYIESTLKDGTLFFSKPSSFEDVHDCEVNIKMYATNAEIRKYIREELFTIDKTIEPEFHRKGYWGNPQKFAAYFNTLPTKKNADKLGINCLCKNPLNKDMWVKYASKEGICIGYKTQRVANSNVIELKETVYYDNIPAKYLAYLDVNYKDTGHPEINRLPTKEFLDTLKEVFLIKDTCWSFEEECRSFVFEENIKKPLGEKGIGMHCSDNSIREVFFSSETSSATKDWVIELINTRPCGNNGVQFYTVDASMMRAIPIG